METESALSRKQNESRSHLSVFVQELFGHIVEFSGDQHGSRFIQQSIQSATDEERSKLFDEIFPEHVLNLMQDVFGNYVSLHLLVLMDFKLNGEAGVGYPEAFRAWVTRSTSKIVQRDARSCIRSFSACLRVSSRSDGKSAPDFEIWS